MAVFEITEGGVGQGKSLYTARTTRKLLARNKKWHAKGFPVRKIWSNLKFCQEFEKEAGEFLGYWKDLNMVCKLRDVDIIWDEIATELDSRNWTNLSNETLRFLSQYRKRGVEIYANTQDFSMIDARARIMINSVQTMTKILGSSDISATKPPPKIIWGGCMIRNVINFKETEPDKKRFDIMPSFLIIKKSLVDIYDTTQDITSGEPPPLKHETRYCEKHFKSGGDGSCDFTKTFHK